MNKLTIKKLKEMKPGVFAKGTMVNSPDGINMTNGGEQLRWVAVRGGIHDWAIYCDFAYKSWEDIKSWGNKVHDEHHIKKLVLCDDESFGMYRH